MGLGLEANSLCPPTLQPLIAEHSVPGLVSYPAQLVFELDPAGDFVPSRNRFDCSVDVWPGLGERDLFVSEVRALADVAEDGGAELGRQVGNLCVSAYVDCQC